MTDEPAYCTLISSIKLFPGNPSLESSDDSSGTAGGGDFDLVVFLVR
jgi:hypothetical protein